MHLIPSFTWEGFFLGPVYVYTWGLTAAIGVLVAVRMAEKKVILFKKLSPPYKGGDLRGGLLEKKFWNFAVLLVIAIFLGARISYILETWGYYSNNPLAIIRLWEGGFSFFGGAIGGILAGYFWGKINKIDFLSLAWVFTPAWLFGLFFGRIGCFLIHDHLGKPTDLPWGVFIQGTYRHEPAMYEALWVLILGVVLLLLDRKYNKDCHPERPCPRVGGGVEGSISFVKILFPFSLFLYSLGRFFIDFTRADDQRFYSLTLAQWLCIVFVSVMLVTIVTLSGSRFSRSRTGLSKEKIN